MKTIINDNEEIKFLIDTCNLSYKEQINLFNIEFGKLLTKSQIGHFRDKYKLRPKAKKIPYVYDMTKKQLNYFEKIVKGHRTDEIINLYYKKYNIKLNNKQVKHLKRKYKLTSGVDTTFKKGQKPHNWKPVGYEFLRNDGYIEIKIAEPNSWQLKHHYIYEKENDKIPDGYSVVFLDQDKTNFNLDNLALVKVKDKLTAKNMNLFSSDKEITTTGLLVAQLINKNSELRKEIK